MATQYVNCRWTDEIENQLKELARSIVGARISWDDVRDALKEEMFKNALGRAKGDLDKTADWLGVSRRSVDRWSK